MDKRFDFPVGSANVDQSLEFTANSVYIDNPTNQWLRLDSLGVTIPQYTVGAIYPLPGTTKAQFSYTALAPQVQPPVIAGQGAAVTFYSLALAPTSGVGMLGGRAPYYDRNPLSVVLGNTGGTLRNANSGTNIEWTYIVPSGRKAYIETAYVMVQISITYANDLAILQSGLSVAPLGGSGAPVALAAIFVGTLKGTIAVGLLGTAMELQATDQVLGVSADSRAAGAGQSVHLITAKITEFDS